MPEPHRVYAAEVSLILPRTGLAFIPVLVTPEDETLEETSDIADAGERAAVEAALAGTGLEAWLAYEPRQRLAKRSFQLVFEP